MAFVAAQAASGSFVSSLTFALNVGSNASRYVLVAAGPYDNTSGTFATGVTYNGVSLTELGTVTQGSRTHKLYGGATSATGSNNVVVTFNNNSSGVAAVAVSYDDISGYRSGSFASQAVTNGLTAVSATSSSAAGDTVVGLLLVTGGSAVSLTPTSPAVGRLTASGFRHAMDEPGAASVTIDGAYSAATNWALLVASLQGAGDTTPPTITGPGGATGATSSISIAEGGTAVHTFTANETVTWSLNGGADVARFQISAGGALSFLAAPDFEAPTDADTNNTYIVGVRATDASSNATTQTCTVTVTDVNEAPTFTGANVPNQVLTVGVAMTPVAIASRFTDPEGLAVTASIVETLPAGLSIVSGNLQGTPSAAQAAATYTPRGTDPGGNGANGPTFTIQVDAAGGGVTFTGTVPAKSGTAGTPFAWGTPALSSYFTGAGTYSVQSGNLAALGLSLDASTGVISGATPVAGTQAVVVRKTATSGSPATADTNSFQITIASAPGTYSATTDVLGLAGIAQVNKPIYWWWLGNSAWPGSAATLEHGSGTTDTQGRYVHTRSQAGSGVFFWSLTPTWSLTGHMAFQPLTLA